MKILIFGASGSGTTTLGKELELKSGYSHLDVDDYYWEKTNPPFQKKIPFSIRIENLKADFSRQENVVVSGSLVSWGDDWEHAFDLAVFLRLDPRIRLERLKNREWERYGELLHKDKITQKNSEDFLAWAARYDHPDFEGRSLKIHLEWISKLNYPVLTLDGQLPLEVKVEEVMKFIQGLRLG